MGRTATIIAVSYAVVCAFAIVFMLFVAASTRGRRRASEAPALGSELVVDHESGARERQQAVDHSVGSGAEARPLDQTLDVSAHERLAAGHMHKPWVHEYGDVLFVNCGVAGKPEDACACLAAEDLAAEEYAKLLS